MNETVGTQLRSDLTFGFLDATVSSQQLYHPQLISNENENTMLRAVRHELSRSKRFAFSVAFVTTGALALLKQALIDFPGSGVIVTSTYLGFNTPEVFRELHSLDGVEVYIHPGSTGGFHPKGYVFQRDDSTTAIIGSSNLTATALLKNKEWNLRFSALPGGDITTQIADAMMGQIQVSAPLTATWIDHYETQYVERTAHLTTVAPERLRSILPNTMQSEALEEIEKVRSQGEKRAVVVSATGTGKTILAALDVRAFDPDRMLFLAHREQILDKAIESFAQVLGLPLSDFGKYVGDKRDLDHRFIFATIQSISRQENLERIDPSFFDYVLVDEVHRAGAESYRRIVNWLEPEFLLGLTATPERTDGFSIYELFDYNVPYEIRLQAALEADMLAPFHYFGVTDYVDVNGNVIDETSNLTRLIAKDRVDHLLNAIDSYGHHGPVRGLIFCSRNDEAAELSRMLNERNVHGNRLRTIALSGNDSIVARERAVADLQAGLLDYIITVDIFNEGIDIPSVNQIIMLRQTQSSIIFTQQLGRGLRKAAGKDHLRVIDFIGNYANNFLIPIALLGDSSLDKDSIKKKLVQAQQAGAIAGLSSINFDEISRDRVLSSLAATKLDSIKNLKSAFLDLKQRLGGVPQLLDFARFDTVDPVVMATKDDNYWALINRFGDADEGPNAIESAILSYFSHELLNGKRPHELLLVQKLLIAPHVSRGDYVELLSVLGCNADEATVDSALRVLSLEFHTSSERKKYGQIPLVEVDANGLLRLSEPFARALEASPTLFEHVTDCIETGLYLARHRHSWRGDLQPGSTYSRKDACRLLNWRSNEYSTIYGYKVDFTSSSCPIFVTYHKDEDVAASTRYEDEFLDHSTLRWFTRSKRTLQSAEVKAIVQNEVPLHLFAKKDDAEGKDFHYLGRAAATAAKQEKMRDDNGRDLDVVTMKLSLERPIEEGLFGYLTSRLERSA